MKLKGVLNLRLNIIGILLFNNKYIMICTVCLRIIISVLRHTIIHETVLKEILCHCSFIYLFILPSRLRLPHCIINV